MRIGIDSYSYHRRYGETRIGERPLPDPWPLEPSPVIAHARALGVDDLFLETCYLTDPETFDAGLGAAAAPVRLGFSWGHPWPAGRYHGLDGGREPGAEVELRRWIEAAGRLGHPVLRITAGSPASRGAEPAEVLVARLVEPMRRAADAASAVGVRLALENHGDLRAEDILDLFERVGSRDLGVCLDNVNLVRVGDDMLEGTRALASRALLVQLKDHLPGDPTIPGGPVCVALAEGAAPLDELVAILDHAGFDGPVCVELASLGGGDVDEMALVERSVEWLRGHVPTAPDRVAEAARPSCGADAPAVAWQTFPSGCRRPAHPPGASPSPPRRGDRERGRTHMAKLRLGVIGAGSWTVSSHLPFLVPHQDEVEFTIINRRNPELLKKIQDKFGFKEATTDWHEVIDAKPDIVVVGSPPGYHHDQAKAALEAGAHVMCEKPFTIDPADAWDLDETTKRTGKALILAYGWNYRPMVIQAHRMMHEDGGVGEIEHVALHMDSVTRELLSETGDYPGADPELIPQPDTWSRPETSGGGYGQAQLTHLLGVSLRVTDLRGQDVFALMSAPLGAKVELHDAVAMRYTNGAIGTMSGASSHLGGANNRHAVEVRVIGSKGMFHLDLRENLLWRYRNPQDDVRVPLEADAGLYDCQGPIDALVEAGMGRPFANNSPAELGARTVEILDAAYRSAKSGVLEHVKTTT